LIVDLIYYKVRTRFNKRLYVIPIFIFFSCANCSCSFHNSSKTQGIRVQELVNVKREDIDFDRCQIPINQGKGNKDRIVPFPNAFKETLVLFVNAEKNKGGIYHARDPKNSSQLV
jgi:hypothetical protein